MSHRSLKGQGICSGGFFTVPLLLMLLFQFLILSCPFCSKRETVFPAFMECDRLKPLFSMLENVFISFNELDSMRIFIFGFKFTQGKRCTCQLLNFVLGQAKLAIYMSMKNKVERCSGEDDFKFGEIMSVVQI